MLGICLTRHCMCCGNVCMQLPITDVYDMSEVSDPVL
jgi:hypothetical protein